MSKYEKNMKYEIGEIQKVSNSKKNNNKSKLQANEDKRVWFSPIQKREELLQDLKEKRIEFKGRSLVKNTA